MVQKEHAWDVYRGTVPKPPVFLLSLLVYVYLYQILGNLKSLTPSGLSLSHST